MEGLIIKVKMLFPACTAELLSEVQTPIRSPLISFLLHILPSNLTENSHQDQWKLHTVSEGTEVRRDLKVWL